MPARELQATATVLAKTLSGERFWRYHALCPENGRLVCLWRRSTKQSGGGPDLFDRTAFLLETSAASGTWFVKEYRTEGRRTGLARRYRSFQLATRLGEALWQNLPHAEFFDGPARLLQEALDAFEQSPLAQCVYLKALYRFAQEEGYPVRQHWLAGLSASECERAQAVILRPLAEQTAGAEEAAATLTEKFERWLRADTDIIVP